MANKARRTTGKKADEGAKLSKGIAYDADGRIVTSLPPPEEGAEYDADGRIVSVPIPPELWEQISAEQAKAVHWRDMIDRVTTKKKTKSKAPSEGWQERRVLPIMRKLWPPHGVPPVSLSQKAALAQVNEIYQPKYGRELPRPTFIRIVKKLKKLFDAK
jgi:hypothetical protein